jgi:uncharacterized membrane protein/plastocyanin
MSENLFDWILLVFRWAHIMAGIMWIGESFFFMWLDSSFIPRVDKQKEDGHVGDLHMVHGGGFYHVQKLLIGPNKTPEKLHWFKWEAAFTWITGMILLALVFYSGGGTFLLDETISNIEFAPAVALSILTIAFSWFFYDFLWESRLSKSLTAHIITIIYFCVVSYFLCQYISGRAAYYHIAAVIGTWMVGNVWMRILPRQAKMIEASDKGELVNQDWAVNAKNRSTHNNYFTLGILFIMIANHFPSTYGHEYNWLILILITVAGASIRHFFNTQNKRGINLYRFLAIGAAFIFSAIYMTSEDSSDYVQEEVSKIKTVKDFLESKLEENHDEKALDQIINHNSTTGINPVNDIKSSISGVVYFSGTPPVLKKLRLPKACAKKHPNGAYDNTIMIQKGKLQNVLVRITSGINYDSVGPIPTDHATLDQSGCLYVPRVIAVRAGQPVDILNSDPVFHNVKAITKNNRKFNAAMPARKKKITKVFDKTEVTINTKCSVHPWMGGHIAVIDHSYFSVSDEDGKFLIKGVPIGNYTIEAWHEKLGVKKIEVNLDKTSKVLDFKY